MRLASLQRYYPSVTTLHHQQEIELKKRELENLIKRELEFRALESSKLSDDRSFERDMKAREEASRDMKAREEF